MKKTKRNKIIKNIKLFLVIIWMITVVMFSSEPGKESSNTSLGFTSKVINVLVSKTNLTIEEKEKIVEKIEPYARKLAHYTLYTIGGVLIINFVNTYELNKRKKVLISIIIGAGYAVTDEFHQYFVEGRSASIKDVGIDALGVITGICLFLCILELICNVQNMFKKNS